MPSPWAADSDKRVRLAKAVPSTVSRMSKYVDGGHRTVTRRSPQRRYVRARIAASGLVLLSVSVVSIGTFAASTDARANTLQNAADDSASGWYPNEPQLTPAAVSGGSFGELFDTQLNGQVYAQPLVSQPTVLAVTENDYAYGLNATTGAIEWTQNYGPPANPEMQISCGDVGSSLGITGTPVIDPATGVAYFVAGTDGGVNGATEWFMEAVNVQTGVAPANWPAGGVQITGSADDDSGTVFNGERETQRPGLVLVNGVVYAAFGSQCDYGPWEGWLIGVSESSASITTRWSSETNVALSSTGPGAGIWQSGSPPVVDSNGDIFVATGNGDIPSTPEPGSNTSLTTYGEAVVELHTDNSGILRVKDWFMPADATQLNSEDGDLGSGGPVALPASMGTTNEQHVMLEDGKQGIMYVLDMNNLGGYQQGTNFGDNVPFETPNYGGIWSKPAVWPGDGGYVYVPTAGVYGLQTNGGSLIAFQRDVNSSNDVTFQLVGATVNSGNTFAYGSGTPIVTSNGTTSGSAVIWIIHDSGSNGLDSQLEAFNPVPVNPGPTGTLEEIWSSQFFTSTVFSAPGVDNGVVYVGTKDSTLMGFGLLASPTPALSGSKVTFSPTVVSQSSSGTAVFTANAPTTVTSFTLSGGAFTMGSPSASLPDSLTTGQSISVPITFTPTALGDNPGSITANVTGGTTEATLDGQGVTPSATFTISPAEVAFAPQLIGGPPTTLGVTFTNVSSNPITISGFKAPALPFTVTNPPANQSLGAGDSLSFTVSFAPPGSSGDFDHEFASVATLDTTAGNFGVAISGSADPPATLTTIPGTVSFGDVDVGSSVTMNFELGNQGGTPLLITQSTPPTGQGFSALTDPFTQLAGTTPADTIAANGSIVETVQFTPTAAGPATAQWSLEGNDGNGIQNVTLTGTGVTPTPSSPPPPSTAPSPPETTTTTTTPPTLEITTRSGHSGVRLILKTVGDPSGGSTTFRVRDGTAKGCSLSGRDLRAASAGTCVVTAKKSASGVTPSVSSPPTIVTFTRSAKLSLAPMVINFAASSSTLTAANEATLLGWMKEWRTGATVIVTGYAKDDATLAKSRSSSIAVFIASKVHVTVVNKANTTVDAAKAIIVSS